MTDLLFFDTDCISAFLWVNEQSILSQLYGGRIIIPDMVYAELLNPSIKHLKGRVDIMLNNKTARLHNMLTDSNEYEHYMQMTTNPEKGFKIIGNGEAAAIALAKEYGGILASNNLRDINQYVSEYRLIHMTTGGFNKTQKKS